jgi:Methyltransferase domain
METQQMPLISDKIAALDVHSKGHVAGTFPTSVLRRLEQLLPQNIERSVETGCGKSTILFSNISEHHTVFCLDDRSQGDQSSIAFFETCELTRNDRVHMVLGPTQKTLPVYSGFKPYDVVLIDGPHGYPFPEIEYYYFYPHLKTGGLLIVDDVHIPTIGRFADVIAEDAMFEPVELVSTTAVFRRTDAPAFDPTGDGWWEQNFNRRRIPRHLPYLEPYVLADNKELPSHESLFRTNVTRTVEGVLRSTASKFLKKS